MSTEATKQKPCPTCHCTLYSDSGELERGVIRDAERHQWLLRNAGYGITKHQHGELYLGDRIIPAPDHIGGLSAAIDAAMLLTPNV